MPKLLTHEDADKEVMQAMGNPSSQAMNAFRSFLSNRGAAGLPSPGMPKLPRDQIKKLPLRTQ